MRGRRERQYCLIASGSSVHSPWSLLKACLSLSMHALTTGPLNVAVAVAICLQ